MSEIPCPRAESAPQALVYTYTPYHWLLAMAGLYFFPQDGQTRIHGQTNISAADKHRRTNNCVLSIESEGSFLPWDDGGEIWFHVTRVAYLTVVCNRVAHQ